jgi:hypothetical protein
MRIRPLHICLCVLAFSAQTAAAALLWVVGIDNADWDFNAGAPGNGGGPNATFVQENGTVNALPGSPASPETDGLSDNDYYFAGSYTSVIASNGAYTPVGPVAANEESVERAFAGGDNSLRYHFNVPPSFGPNDRVTVSFDALNLDTSGADPRWGVEVYINGNLVRPEEIIRAAQLDEDYTSAPRTLAEVGIRTGAGADNIVTLKGISYNYMGGGNWMGIDYVKMDIDSTPLVINSFTTSDPLLRPGETATLTWVLAGPTATVSINGDIGDVTHLTTNGTGSIVVSPTTNTTYTLTATSVGQTQTKSVTVNTTTWSAIFEAGVDNASRAEFSHEDAADDNYYFAGDYTSAGGPNQLTDESLNDDTNTDTVAGRTGNPAVGFERALSELDPVMNIWFVPPPAMVKPESSIRVSADVLSASGSNALEFSINETVLHTRTGISNGRLVQFEVTGLTSSMIMGPNKLTIRRVGTTLGGNVIFDFVMLEHLVGTLPAISEITHDSILGTHTVNWIPIPLRTYRVEKSTDAGASWILLAEGFPAGGAPGTGIFFEDRLTPPTDPVPAYRVLLE